MRILHTADWHVGRAIRGRSRAEEHRAVLAEIVAIASDQQVDLCIVAGDLFDSAAPAAEAEQIVYQTLADLADQAPVIAIAGNHDNPRRFRALRPFVRGAGRIHLVPTVSRPDAGGVIEVAADSGERALVAVVPFLSQTAMVRADQLMGMRWDQQVGEYRKRAEAIIRLLCDALDDDAVNLLTGHLMTMNATPGESERAIHTGIEYAVSPSAFDATRLQFVALGHIHARQQIDSLAPSWYAGAPLQLDFGETTYEPAIGVIEAQPGRPVRHESIRLTAGKRLRVLSGSLVHLATYEGKYPEDHLRIVVEEPPRAGLAEAVREQFPNAVEVRLPEAERTAAEVDLERESADISPTDLFGEFLTEEGITDKRIPKLFAELLEQVHAAD